MPLMRLIYFSRPRVARPLEAFHAACDQILETSRRNNEASALTGALAASPDLFVQALEGTHEALRETYRRIADDDRHDALHLVDTRPIGTRRFPDWRMAFAEIEALPAELRAIVMTGSRPDCADLSPDAILDFLERAVRHEAEDHGILGLAPTRRSPVEDDIVFV